MSPILKHSFEAVSLLTTDNGMLDITIIPAQHQPDWLIPSALILSVEDYRARVDTYEWQQQQLAVFHIQPQEQDFDKIIVLEGNTSEHRIALQTTGELRQTRLRISDMYDIELPQSYQDMAITTADTDTDYSQVKETELMSYMLQTVMIDDKPYLIPDLDKIAHHFAYLGQ